MYHRTGNVVKPKGIKENVIGVPVKEFGILHWKTTKSEKVVVFSETEAKKNPLMCKFQANEDIKHQPLSMKVKQEHRDLYFLEYLRQTSKVQI